MKKIFVVITFFITFLLIYFIQSNFFSWYNISGIKPNLFIILSLFIGLYLKKTYGFALGILFGILLDFFLGKKIGLNSIMLGIAGFTGGILDKSFTKDNRITFMIMAATITILCEIINYTLQIILLKADANFMQFMKLILIEAFSNSCIIIILYPLIQKVGKKIETIFTGQKSLLKYY